MSLNLLLMVVEGSGDSRYAHTHLSVTHVGHDLSDAICDLPRESAVGIACYLAPHSDLTGFVWACKHDHDLIGWGELTRDDDLTSSFRVVRWRHLRALAGHAEVAATVEYRAAWVYLDAVMPDDGAVLIGFF